MSTLPYADEERKKSHSPHGGRKITIRTGKGKREDFMGRRNSSDFEDERGKERKNSATSGSQSLKGRSVRIGVR